MLCLRPGRWALAVTALLLSMPVLPIASSSPGPVSMSLYQGTIFIDGNGNFTPASGVVGGSGTPSDPFVIAGWTILAPSGPGIQIRNTNAYFVIRDVAIRDGSPTNPGVWLQGVANGQVLRLSSTGNRYGVVIQNSDNLTISASDVRLNDYEGISVTNSTRIVLANNRILDNGLYGVHVLDTSSANLTGNTVGGNGYLSATPIEVFFEAAPAAVFADNLLLAQGASGVYLSASPNGVVRGNSVANHSFAVFLESSDSTRVVGNSFVSNGFAVYVHSESVSVSENVFRDNGYGLYVFQQGNATIDGNQFSAFGGQGVVLWGSQRNRIRANRFNYTGVLLEGTTVNAFDSHEIASSNLVNGKPLRYYHDCGSISLDGQPTGQLLVSNCTAFRASNLTIGQTDVAVELAYVHDAVLEHNVLWGSFYGLRLIASSGVFVTHNSFALNSVQVSGRDRETWDAGYPSGGNYWSDYGGADDCSGTLQDVCPDADGIGDTPYTVSIAGDDRYPTTRPFNALPLPLAASFTMLPASGDTSSLFVLNASTSSDPNGPDSGILVRWDFDGNGVWDTDWSLTKTVAHRFEEPGSHTVRLEIMDGQGLMANMTREVFVEPVRFLGVEIPLAVALLSGAAIMIAVVSVLSLRWIRRRRELDALRFGTQVQGKR